MFWNLLQVRYSYTVESLIYVRKVVSSKICYKKSLHFLVYKYSLTQSLSNRLVDRSNYYQSYKLLRQYYVATLRANFTKQIFGPYQSYLWTTFDNKKFLSLYLKTGLAREFDYTLLWRATQFNSLFNLATTITKKKKRYHYKHRTFFIANEKRLLFVWRWLKTFLYTLRVKSVSKKLTVIRGFENFLLAPDNANVINLFKLQIYKLHLLRIT